MFLLIKSWKIIIKKRWKKNQCETPKRYSVKNSNKTQDNEITLTQNRYEVLSCLDESDTNRCNNDNGKLSNNVTASISSQVNLRNDDVKEDWHKHKSKTKKKKWKGS